MYSLYIRTCANLQKNYVQGVDAGMFMRYNAQASKQGITAPYLPNTMSI